jgi:hypothetical protein
MATVIELTDAVKGLINFDPRKILEIEPPSPLPAPRFPLQAHVLAFSSWWYSFGSEATSAESSSMECTSLHKTSTETSPTTSTKT